ncbi:unnamed protein product, partial [Colias eurytheme]
MINYYSTGNYTTGDNQLLPSTITLVPAGNSCHIPGCKNVMLVLLDCTSSSAPANILLGDGAFVVPTVTRPADAADASLSDMWNAYFTDANVPRLRRDFLELCHAQDLGLIMGVQPDGYPTAQQAAHGAWTHGGFPIGPDNFQLSTSPWPAEADSDDARDTLTGYNFRKLSPFHRLSTGRVSALFRLFNYNGREVAEVSWGTRRPNVFFNGYKIPTLASAMRLSIATNLISIGHQKYSFTSAAGAAGWLSMNGAAVAFSTGVHLTTTNFTLRDWAGLSAANDDTTIDQLVGQDLQTCTG